jgi:hypothetical protein
MTKHITKKQVLLLMLIIFCILPFGCSGRHDNTEVEKTASIITALEAVSGQTFYGVADFLRKSSLQQDQAKCEEGYQYNYFDTLLLQEEAPDEGTDIKTKAIKFRAFTDKKNATPYYNFESTTCTDTDIAVYSFSVDKDNVTVPMFYLVPNRGEVSFALKAPPTESTKNLTQTISLSSKDSYYYIYPIKTENSGITLNILDNSTLLIQYSPKVKKKEGDETYYNFDPKHIETVTKRINLKIETKHGTYYANLRETTKPDESSPDTAPIDLFRNKEKTEKIINYQMVIDYYENKIRFVKEVLTTKS